MHWTRGFGEKGFGRARKAMRDSENINEERSWGEKVENEKNWSCNFTMRIEQYLGEQEGMERLMV